jgi:hypothetical protein
MCGSSPRPQVQLPPGFESSYYLQHNPDVAAAVQRGDIATGADHYLKWGHKEGRPGVNPVADQNLQMQRNQFNFQMQMANAQRQAEQARANRVNQGMSLIDSRFNFGNNFFREREQDYLNWANPQLDEQYQDAQKQLTFGLSRMGHGQGSQTMTDRWGRLEQDNAQNRANIADQAKDVSNQARGLIGQQRAQLINLAQMAADPSAVRNQIGRSMSDVQAYKGFDPTSNLNPMFQNVTAGLGSFLDGLRMGGTGQDRLNLPPIYNTPTSGGSGRVVT